MIRLAEQNRRRKFHKSCMDQYRLDLLSEQQFENLVVRICRDILGSGVTGFSRGADGGRDARFEGKANCYPSVTEPWIGKTIVQAKHSSNSEASCSDKGFFGNKSSIIQEEIPKIRKLKQSGELDNYLCFTNRKLTGGKESEIRKAIIDETEAKNVGLLGLPFIETSLTPDIIRSFDLKRYLVPFEFYEKDIRKLITFFGERLASLPESLLEKVPTLLRNDIFAKNELNSLSRPYFENSIEASSLKYFKQIEDFLCDPRNSESAKFYQNTTIELQAKILTFQNDGQKFEEIFEHVYKFIFDEHNQQVVDNRYLIYVFLHFMYYQCDIGRNK